MGRGWRAWEVEMSTEMTIHQSAMPAIYTPRTFAEARDLAGALVKSGLLPRSVNSPEAALVIMIAGAELGLPTMTALRNMHVIDGKATLSADLTVALVKKSPACIYFRLVHSDANVAEYETERRNEGGPTRLSFTIEEAQAAGLLGNKNWQKFPAAMLRARAASQLARAVYPDVVAGVYDPDELASDEAPAASPRRESSPPRRVQAPPPVRDVPPPRDAEIVDDDTGSLARTEPRAPRPVVALIADLDAAPDAAAVKALRERARDMWLDLGGDDRGRLTAAMDSAKARTATAPAGEVAP